MSCFEEIYFVKQWEKVKYIKKTTKHFKKNEIYTVISGCRFNESSNKFEIAIWNKHNQPHILQEDYFKDNFVRVTTPKDECRLAHMINIKKGNLVRYIGSTDGNLTHNQLYEVWRGYTYDFDDHDFYIYIIDDDKKYCAVSEEYFYDKFIRE